MSTKHPRRLCLQREPDVRHRSREELLREIVDQGYNVNQYKL